MHTEMRANTDCVFSPGKDLGRRKKEEGRRKKEGGRRKEEGGRRKEEGGRRKEEGGRMGKTKEDVFVFVL
jgi:hypothetical protein